MLLQDINGVNAICVFLVGCIFATVLSGCVGHGNVLLLFNGKIVPLEKVFGSNAFDFGTANDTDYISAMRVVKAHYLGDLSVQFWRQQEAINHDSRALKKRRLQVIWP